MNRLAPSILSADFSQLGAQIQAIEEGGADIIHVDVMDGHFVPNISYGAVVMKSLLGKTKLPFDVHLMIEKPERFIVDFAKAGADLLCIHLEADHPTGIARALKLMEEHGVKKGIALRPIASAESVLPYIKDVDLVLVMTVEPGFGGQAFMADQLPKIRKIREYINEFNPECRLEVDGGIAADTAPLVIEAGADTLVAGSAVYGNPDRAAAIAALRG